jgi:coatomer protein complex subunit alpha (xenin)
MTDPLAYYTAKTNGLDDTALDILEEAGMTEDDLPPPPQNSGHSTLAPPPIAFSQSESNWPIKDLGVSFFDRALANGGMDAESSTANGTGEQLDAWAVDAGGVDDGDLGEDHAAEDEGWDLDAEVVEVPEEEEVDDVLAPGESSDLSEGVSQGVSENEMWMRNSPLAADHAAAGAFESAMQVSLLVLPAMCNALTLSASQSPSRGCTFRTPQTPLHAGVPARPCPRSRKPISPPS